MHDQRLMDYFKFDESDLEANRAGDFSDAQKDKIRTDQAGAYNRTIWTFAWAVPLAVGLLGWMALLLFQGHVNGSNGGLVVNLGIWGFIALLVALFALRGVLTKHRFRLAKVQGPIKIVREVVHGRHRHTSVYHELHVGGEEFSVDESLADVMQQGDEYTVYYDLDNDSTGSILSVELISKSN